MRSQQLFIRLLFLVTLLVATNTFGQTTGFSYQGSLRSNGGVATGQYDFEFALFDGSTGNNQIGTTISKTNVAVTGGVFSVTLDFGGSAFSGADRWLEISAKLTTDSTFTTLSPRQQITATPYTIQSLNATNATNAIQLGGVAANQYVLTGDTRLSDARMASGVNFNTATLNGVLPIANGGTGSPTQTFVDLSNNQNIGGNKNFTGILTGNGSGLSNVSGTFQWQVVTGTSQQARPNNGYAVDNASQVTITLPASPNVGDTVRISGLGTGGWKIAQNGQSILGSNLGGIWIPRASSRVWLSVASSADGIKLVAVVQGGQIYTSTDSGATWTPRDSNRGWVSVASSTDGSKLVALVFNGQIYTSTDAGVSWTPHENSRTWTSVASSADGTKLVAVVGGFFNSGQIFTSTDSGVSWTPRENSRNWVSVASSADGSKLVAAVINGQIYTSSDSGATWTPRDSTRTWISVASSADGSKLAAAESGGKIYTSTDSGVIWTLRDSNRGWISVASSADGSILAAVVLSGQIYTSTDSGVTWTAHENIRNWRAIASSADGTKMIAAVNGGQIYTSDAAMITTPGPDGYLVGTQYVSIELQYIGKGQFLVISQQGTVTGF